MNATYEAPGKFIIVGEHFVVHGVPAVAAPVTGVRTCVSVSSSPSERLDVPVQGEAAALAYRVFRAALAQVAALGGAVAVDVQSTIPVGFGLGSSAAYSVGLAGALARYADEAIDVLELRRRAHALERLIHGRPSGIDDTVISLERPVVFADGEMEPVALAGTFRFVLASCEYPGITKDAVASVTALASAEPDRFSEVVAAAREVTAGALVALAAGDVSSLGAHMNRAHELLTDVRVSTEELNTLVGAARGAGAYGAKLTGGGYGGFMVALVDEGMEQRVSEALKAAGARHVLTTEIGATPAPA